ncbi:uncharacterized protein LOC129227202 [Uloborus diversus]|uniref:uncharacterized protein LOC129227202 n=1 Tax=Uloborus diversus TaxID=327109 RepID=UPI0024090A60|nr:uncharacterized protein LOC129227202 [Uloborus diversus]
MATSVQACLHSSCKSQHQMKSSTKSPTVLRRSSMRQNAANRKSAVERLEESKANYVKSERVLDSKQEFKNSSHLRVSTGPHLDALFKAPSKQPAESIGLSNAVDDVKLSYLRIHHHPNVQVSKSPPLRVRAKSHSEFRETHLTRKHSFASQCSRHRIEVLIDIESQLKRLITSGSHENISIPQEAGILGTAHQKAQLVPKISKPSEIPKVRRGYSDPVRKSCWPPPDLSPDPDVSIHKSMPDLSPSPCSPRVIVPSSSHNSDNFVADHEETVQYFTPQRKVSTNSTAIKKIERCNEGVDSFEEPRRFSNGTGMLHLTPYYSATSQLQRKPVSRSKSDVSHRYSKRNSDYLPWKSNYTSAEIERFFDTMGLDTNVWHRITSPSLVSSPPCFFESVSSVDSNEDKSSACSEDSVSEVPREGLRNHDLRGHGPLETSIVEKNARVIKWLYNCRKSACES